MRELSQAEEATIEALHLEETARNAAKILKAEHPNIVFTSGRRTVADQAHAMASNIVKSGNRHWIGQTYLAGQKLQHWVDQHPQAKTVDEITAGLTSVMNGMTDDERAHLSKHLIGRAFDVQPVTQNAAAIEADINKLPGKTKFLTKEGGLVRWHVQF